MCAHASTTALNVCTFSMIDCAASSWQRRSFWYRKGIARFGLRCLVVQQGFGGGAHPFLWYWMFCFVHFCFALAGLNVCSLRNVDAMRLTELPRSLAVLIPAITFAACACIAAAILHLDTAPSNQSVQLLAPTVAAIAAFLAQCGLQFLISR